MANLLVDTDVLIDISKGSSAAAKFLDNLKGDVYIGRVSAMELIAGARDKREQRIIEEFINGYQIKELSEPIGNKAYEYLKQYSRSHGLVAMDAIVAATAVVNDLNLASKNEKHFRPLKNLKYLKTKY
ncbi:MAG: type II toxin-antitoxin system VapC family toxin [Candidatus Brocadiales bacterium]